MSIKWAGLVTGWGTAIYLTLYMTVLSFIIGGFLGQWQVFFLVLTAPGGVLENKSCVFLDFGCNHLFPCGSFIILWHLVSPIWLLNKYRAKCSPCPTFFCSLCLLLSLVRCRWSWPNWWRCHWGSSSERADILDSVGVYLSEGLPDLIQATTVTLIYQLVKQLWLVRLSRGW